MLRLAICVGLVISLFLAGCKEEPWIEPGSDYSPEKVFQHIIKYPLPDSISLLQGDAQTWQGYDAWLRFKASSQDIDFLISSGFIPVEWQEISTEFKLTSDFKDKFKPAWKPKSLKNKKCYINKAVKNDWTHFGTHYLVVDRDSGIVYFYGIGS